MTVTKLGNNYTASVVISFLSEDLLSSTSEKSASYSYIMERFKPQTLTQYTSPTDVSTTFEIVDASKAKVQEIVDYLLELK